MNKFLKLSKDYFKSLKTVNIKSLFSEWTLWEKSWVVISTVMIIASSIITWDSTNKGLSSIALIASVTGVWTVILVAKGKNLNYVVGLVNSIFYAYMAYTTRLYGDMMLNLLFYVPFQFIGWYYWLRNCEQNKSSTVAVLRLSNLHRIIGLILVSLVVAIYGVFLKSLDGNTPFIDSISTVLSIVASILMLKRFLEQWILWVFVNIVSIIMWINVIILDTQLVNVGVLMMWVAFLVNSLYGYYNWKKLNKEMN